MVGGSDARGFGVGGELTNKLPPHSGVDLSEIAVPSVPPTVDCRFTDRDLLSSKAPRLLDADGVDDTR